jgi:predicted anti-sigma-YlaC factor YlaD
MTMPHIDDETLSALLDGEGEAADAAHLESCPTCRGRRDQLAAAAAAVAEGVPSDPEVREAHLRAALAVDTVVTPLRRPRPSPRLAWLGAAAAALVVVAGGVLALGSVGSSSAKRTATASLPASPVTGGPAAAGGSAAAAPVAAMPDLGDQTDVATLAAVVRADVAGRAKAATVNGQLRTPAPVSPCVAGAQAAAEALSPTAVTNPAPVYVATLRWRGQPATVFAFSRAGPATALQIEVMGQGSCVNLASTTT